MKNSEILYYTVSKKFGSSLLCVSFFTLHMNLEFNRKSAELSKFGNIGINVKISLLLKSDCIKI